MLKFDIEDPIGIWCLDLMVVLEMCSIIRWMIRFYNAGVRDVDVQVF